MNYFNIKKYLYDSKARLAFGWSPGSVIKDCKINLDGTSPIDHN